MNKYLIKDNIIALVNEEDVKLIDIFWVSIQSYAIAIEDGKYGDKDIKAGDLFILLYGDRNPIIISRENPFAQYAKEAYEERCRRYGQEEYATKEINVTPATPDIPVENYETV